MSAINSSTVEGEVYSKLITHNMEEDAEHPPILRFTIKSERRVKDAAGNGKIISALIPVIVYGSKAEKVYNFINKGDIVVVSGSLETTRRNPLQLRAYLVKKVTDG